MPYRNLYSHYKLGKSQRGVASVTSFGGVDLSSAMFNASNSRAILLKNYIYKKGFVRKRSGYEQIFKAAKIEYHDAFSSNFVEYFTNGTNFNGIWKFKAEDGNEHVVAHIGNLLFEINNIENNNDIEINYIRPYTETSSYGDRPYLFKFEDYKSSAFVGNNRLWFLGGNKYMCLRFKEDGTTSFYPVASQSFAANDETELPFIPVTSINITYVDSVIQTRTAYDFPNKLTKYRKNKLLSGTGKTENITTDHQYYEYVLDSPLITPTSIAPYAPVSGKITIDYLKDDLGGKDTIEAYFRFARGTTLPDNTEMSGNLLEIRKPNEQEGDELIGVIYDCDKEDACARVILFEDYKPPIRSSSNIEITFPSIDSSGDINKCHFGILFGSNNAQNRLFLSGNPDIPNADWHSSEPNYTDYNGKVTKTNGNFSYFADESVMYYGETDNEIVGYEVVSNDKLLVLKNKSDKEKTVYFRTPILAASLTTTGEEELDVKGETLYREEFALKKGNNSVAGISPKTIVNFNGDTLFLDSNNQLVGLDVEGILGDNQRYANTRSRYIDRALDGLDLSNAIVWTDNTYLFISIKNYGLFVTHFKTYNAETRQYEWFFLTCENPTVFLEKDGVYYFGNDEGELYKFTKGVFVDVKKVFSNYTLKYNEGSLVVSKSVIDEIKRIGIEKTYLLKTLIPSNATYESKMFYKIASMSSDAEEDADIYIDNENNCLVTALDLPQNTDFYLSNIDAEEADLGDVLGVKFRVEQIEFDGERELNKYKLIKCEGDEEDWSYIDINDFDSAIMCGCLEDDDIYVKSIHEADEEDEEDVNTITLSKGSSGNEAIKLVIYGDQQEETTFRAELRTQSNVEALYIVSPFTMGNINRFKTIWSFTITNDSNEPSEVEVAYASNKFDFIESKKMSFISISKEQLGLDYDYLNFFKIDFDKLIVPRTYTCNRVLSRQKFICFVFKNYNNTDSILSGMTVTYSLPFASYSGD